MIYLILELKMVVVSLLRISGDIYGVPTLFICSYST